MKKIEYPRFAREILIMVARDQRMRRINLKNENYWNPRLDRTHTSRMRNILAKIGGWPTIPRVGKAASNVAWLLVQHADHNPMFQDHCLRLMKACDDGEVALPDIAHLEDRVCVNTGSPQVYGTQFADEVDGRLEPRKIRDPKNVDARRKAMGLDTLKQNIRRMQKKYPKRSRSPFRETPS